MTVIKPIKTGTKAQSQQTGKGKYMYVPLKEGQSERRQSWHCAIFFAWSSDLSQVRWSWSGRPGSCQTNVRELAVKNEHRLVQSRMIFAIYVRCMVIAVQPLNCRTHREIPRPPLCQQHLAKGRTVTIQQHFLYFWLIFLGRPSLKSLSRMDSHQKPSEVTLLHYLAIPLIWCDTLLPVLLTLCPWSLFTLAPWLS